MEQYTFSSCLAGAIKAAQMIVRMCKEQSNSRLYTEPTGIPIVLLEFFAVQLDAYNKATDESNRQNQAEYILGIYLTVISFASRDKISEPIVRFMLQYFDYKCHNTPMLEKLSIFKREDLVDIAELVYMIDPETHTFPEVGLN